jgi:hypothetical protein
MFASHVCDNEVTLMTKDDGFVTKRQIATINEMMIAVST